MDDLISAVAAKNLPHYFIQGVNLIENISDETLQTVGYNLVKLRRNPISLANSHGPETSEQAVLERCGFGKSSSICGGRYTMVQKGDKIESVKVLPSESFFEFDMEEHGTEEGGDRFEMDMRLLALKYGCPERKISVIRNQRTDDIKSATQNGRKYKRSFIPQSNIENS